MSDILNYVLTPEEAERLRVTEKISLARLREIAEALESSRDWTPCAEGMPDIMRRVIVTASGEIVIASKQHELDDDETTPIHWYDDEGCRFNDDIVTAWMPMPEPWTGGLDGK